MHESATALVTTLMLLFGDGSIRPVGELVTPPVVTYLPREGDLVFYDDRSLIWTPLFFLSGTGPPLHMGIVVRKSSAGLALLEAGPDDTVWVRLLDLRTRLDQFQRDFPKGTISIRRCKKSLDPKTSAALTKFAEAQDGKRYAVLRLLLQGTKYRARGPLEPWLGRTDLDRDSWMCAEISVAAGTIAGLFKSNVKSNIAYPRDLIDNRRYDLGGVWEDADVWRRPARIKSE